MSFDSLMIHPLVLVSVPLSHAEGDLDDYGQPTPGTPVVTPFMGRVYAKSEREVSESQQTGAGVADYRIRTRATIDPVGVDYIAHADPEDTTQEDASDDRRYEIVGVARRNDRGGEHHLSIECKLVTATPGAR